MTSIRPYVSLNYWISYALPMVIGSTYLCVEAKDGIDTIQVPRYNSIVGIGRLIGWP